MNFAVALASNRIPNTKVNLAKFEANSQTEILNKAIGEVLNNEISANTKTTLLKQIAQPLPEVKLAEDNDEMEMAMTAGGNGQGRRGQMRQARLLNPTGNAEVFKVVGLASRLSRISKTIVFLKRKNIRNTNNFGKLFVSASVFMFKFSESIYVRTKQNSFNFRPCNFYFCQSDFYFVGRI